MQADTHQKRKRRALRSLEGLSIGDAFGERLFVASEAVHGIIEKRIVTAGHWRFTDDTQMALSIVEILGKHQIIDQDALALSFARHYDDRRGYGPAMNGLLRWIGTGTPWRELSRGLFQGQGSCGNGAAMRVAPLGGYFADDVALAVEQARLSAEVTHSHPEGIAGAVAVAVAAATAWDLGRNGERPDRSGFVDRILPFIPDGLVRDRCKRARDLPAGSSVRLAASVLGNGSEVTAQDTVPFVLWCAGESLDDFQEALWLTVSGLGDRDTTCAMVGGIVSLYYGDQNTHPLAWSSLREELPGWPISPG